MNEINFTNNFNKFITELDQRLKSIGIQLDDHVIDHVCYRCSDANDYRNIIHYIKSICRFHFVKMHHDRSFNCFVLKKPLVFTSHEILYVEISEPGGSDSYKTGFQHIEICSRLSYKQIGDIEKIPSLLFKGSKGDEEYIKWNDKLVFKITEKPFITKILEDENVKLC